MLSIPDMAIIGALALIVFGPEQLPKVARKAGQVIRDVQNTSQSFIREMERAADDTPPYVPPVYEAYEPNYIIPPDEPSTIDASVTEGANDRVLHDATQAIDILAETVPDREEAAVEVPVALPPIAEPFWASHDEPVPPAVEHPAPPTPARRRQRPITRRTYACVSAIGGIAPYRSTVPGPAL
jgi:sec-independent protein translocase protein TatA